MTCRWASSAAKSVSFLRFNSASSHSSAEFAFAAASRVVVFLLASLSGNRKESTKRAAVLAWTRENNLASHQSHTKAARRRRSCTFCVSGQLVLPLHFFKVLLHLLPSSTFSVRHHHHLFTGKLSGSKRSTPASSASAEGNLSLSSSSLTAKDSPKLAPSTR